MENALCTLSVCMTWPAGYERIRCTYAENVKGKSPDETLVNVFIISSCEEEKQVNFASL